MRLLGFDISRVKASSSTPVPTIPGDRGRWWYSLSRIHEPFTGAWQRNMETRVENLLVFNAIYACVTLIASDIAKLRIKLVELVDGIWTEIEVPAFSPVLRKPNRYQTRIQFMMAWIVSKLVNGNAYILKVRDARKVVVELYVLDPMRTKVLVTPSGDIYYQLSRDDLSGIKEDVVVPASEIIHDVMVPLYHPLCGVSPITACAMAAVQGLSIQRNSAGFFQNGSKPGGILTAPGPIDEKSAERLKEYWEKNFTGENAGRIAVVGDGLKYEMLTVSAVDAQLIEQLKWTAETVCSCFHVPPYMIGVGTMPTYNNIEALNQQYYAQCLQSHIESGELLLDEGLGLRDQVGKTYGTEFDLDDLLRMDTATKVKAAADGISAGFLAPNEARAKFDLKPVKGGESPLVQQQNYSLAALAKRDAKEDPFAGGATPPAAAGGDEPDVPDDDDESTEDAARSFSRQIMMASREHEQRRAA